jgi:hypothetical protein
VECPLKYRVINNGDPLPTRHAESILVPVQGNQTVILEPIGSESMPLTYKAILPLIQAVEAPASGTTQSGVWKIRGYASEYDPARNIENIKSIQLILDDDEVHYFFPLVTMGKAHTAFATAHPEYKQPNAGFEIELNTASLPMGVHQFKLRFNRVNGAPTVIQALVSITIAAPPVDQPQLPIKYNLDTPASGASVADILTVEGWVLEPHPQGLAPNGNGNIAYVEALLVGGPINTSIGVFNGPTWKYRADVAATFPQYNNGNSGFVIQYDLNQLPNVNTTTFNLVLRIYRHVGGMIEMGRAFNMTTQTSGVVEAVPPAQESRPPTAPVPTGNYRTKVGGVNIKTAADYAAPNIRTVAAGYVYQAIQQINSVWMKVRCPDGLEGYTDIPSSQFMAYSGDMLADSILAFGDNYLGVTYKFGAAPYNASTNPHFDCSSFCQFVAKNFGVTIPRGSGDQAEKYNPKLSREQLRKGDFMYFSVSSRPDDYSNGVAHVGIYAGDNRILHTYSVNGGPVMFMTLTTSWWGRFKWGARWITPNGDGYIH